jgi:hypothetical protein
MKYLMRTVTVLTLDLLAANVTGVDVGLRMGRDNVNLRTYPVLQNFLADRAFETRECVTVFLLDLDLGVFEELGNVLPELVPERVQLVGSLLGRLK